MLWDIIFPKGLRGAVWERTRLEQNSRHSMEDNRMAEQENSKDLISVLWSGADILRIKTIF